MIQRSHVPDGRKSVGIWIRVSTEDQAQGDSPEHHERRARLYAEAKGWQVAEVYRLEAVSGTAWVQTGESGTPLIGVPGSGTCGTLSSGVLESSNVDITSELVNLMTAQRNYQANTKVIATSTQLDDALFQAM